ncbi:hypothetical protein V490_02636 [Pseudogymnoascus sp. VKM F-3557]|nr:hypothetical protein V490_02636 [Pseudogymnoascus sp. VKM F-3557]
MAKPKSQRREANVNNASPPLTQENFEKELKELAKRAKEETPFNHAVEWAGTTVRAVVILALAAASSSVSQLTLSPVGVDGGTASTALGIGCGVSIGGVRRNWEVAVGAWNSILCLLEDNVSLVCECYTEHQLQVRTTVALVLAGPARGILRPPGAIKAAPSPWATQALNSSLLAQDYRLIARQDSNTGYISVLESVSSQFRVLRCDHSLLGGIWTMQQPGYKPVVGEPVYAIFTMLEAVRLIEAPVSVPDSEAQALVIGAGIGTSPGALMAHGINTTIVEIDPVVLEYAVKYFDLAPNHHAVIDDAVHYAAKVANNTAQRYDYIIHDVFTGGAEPIALFTDEFLRNLHRALKPDGVIAINYASDLLQPSTHLIIRTVLAIFPSCRIYRETAKPTAIELVAAGQDFTNMVFFCRAHSEAPITFREPVERDYLRSGARKAYLVPKHEILREEFDLKDVGDVLRANNTAMLEETQQKSAVGHWNVMRTVVPGKIWELW